MGRVGLAGFVGGALIALITILTEHYGPTYGGYSLFGNGALIVPALLAPFAIFAGWTWARSRGGRALELALFVLGLHFGVGLVSVLDAAFFPSSPSVTVLDALPGFVLSGAIFVLPSALLATSAYWVCSRLHGITLALAVAVCVLIAAYLAGLFGAGLGLVAGAGVALAERMPERTFALGAIVFLAIVVIGNLTYLTLLLALPG